MKTKTVDSPQELAEALLALFPEFSGELDDESAESYHQVFQLFAPRAAALLASASQRSRRSFAGLVNAMVSAGGLQENAVSTCLLEHASQIGIRKLIRPLLSSEAKCELR